MSTRQQAADREVHDLLTAGVQSGCLYVNHGVSGGRAFCPAFNKAIAAVEEGGTLVIIALNRLGHLT